MDENRRSARLRKLESERANRRRPCMEEEEEESSPEKRRSIKKRQVVKVHVGSEVVEIGVGTSEAVEIGVGKTEVEVNKSEDKTGVEVKKSNEKETGEMVASEENAVVGGEKSAYARVLETLRSFNKHYLHFVQEEEKRCGSMDGEKRKAKSPKKKNGQDLEENKKNSSRRPDLKAINKMRLENDILYPNKRIGSIPGVDVGHQFFSRCEMVSVGFHSHWLSGIDYVGSTAKLKEFSSYKLPLAVAIVMSGQYEDDLDNSDEVVYTGQGGNDLLGNKRQISDQAMVRGNLGLKNCMDQAIPVRVIRGHQSKSSYVGKVYTYDGLYKVTKYWAEKGVSGFLVYKFGLKRLEGQPSMTTDQVRFSRGQIPNNISEIRGLVCEDITGGLENIPIPATNTVDDPPVPPTGLTYLNKIQISKSVKCPVKAPGCDCNGYCVDPKKCACARLNGSDFPYVHRDGGRLVEPKDVVFECGPNCGCGPECVNRTSQKGIRYRFEVYKTPKKGWAVRSWDYIPAGALICEYIGKLMRTEEVDSVPENNYAFDIDCRQTIKGLDGRERRSRAVSIPSYLEKDDDADKAPEFCLDAGDSGNFARYINHSCQPNLFVQCVLSTHHDIDQARLVLFAADNIPPLKELTYDYGYAIDSVVGPDGEIKQLPCFCGAADCRKRMF